MEFNKKALDEIIDSNGDLIGLNDIPTNGSDLESQANGTTDSNAKIGQQPFRYDMLGRFGFTLMPFMEEGTENQGQTELLTDLTELMFERYKQILKFYYQNPNKLKSDYRKISDGDIGVDKHVNTQYAKKAMKIMEKHFENAFNEPEAIDETIDDNGYNTSWQQKPIEERKPLTIKSKLNDQFYITFNFDKAGRLDSVRNNWHIGYPDWLGLAISDEEIFNWINKNHPDFYAVKPDSLTEVNVVEDKMIDKKSEDEITSKSDDNEVRAKKLEKIAGLINKMDRGDVNKLINLLEIK